MERIARRPRMAEPIPLSPVSGTAAAGTAENIAIAAVRNENTVILFIIEVISFLFTTKRFLMPSL